MSVCKEVGSFVLSPLTFLLVTSFMSSESAWAGWTVGTDSCLDTRQSCALSSSALIETCISRSGSQRLSPYEEGQFSLGVSLTVMYFTSWQRHLVSTCESPALLPRYWLWEPAEEGREVPHCLLYTAPRNPWSLCCQFHITQPLITPCSGLLSVSCVIILSTQLDSGFEVRTIRITYL